MWNKRIMIILKPPSTYIDTQGNTHYRFIATPIEWFIKFHHANKFVLYYEWLGIFNSNMLSKWEIIDMRDQAW